MFRISSSSFTYLAKDTTMPMHRGAREELSKLVEKFRQCPKQHLLALRLFLEDNENNNSLKSWVSEDDVVSFETAWEGALAVLHTFEDETDSRFQKADLHLLFEDLNKLTDYIFSASIC